MMTLDQFWDLIRRSRLACDDMDEQADLLVELLAALPPAEIVEFDQRLQDMLERAYRWDLWGAATLIQGTRDEDEFEYFRAWLVSLGEEDFETALEDPDWLAAVLERPDVEDTVFEDLLYVPLQAYHEVTGQDLPPVPRPLPKGPLGERWDEEDLESLYPRLSTFED